MKKLKLKSLNFEGAEILSREQLKKIMGGGMMGTTPGGTDPITTVPACPSFDCVCVRWPEKSGRYTSCDPLEIGGYVSGCGTGSSCTAVS